MLNIPDYVKIGIFDNKYIWWLIKIENQFINQNPVNFILTALNCISGSMTAVTGCGSDVFGTLHL